MLWLAALIAWFAAVPVAVAWVVYFLSKNAAGVFDFWSVCAAGVSDSWFGYAVAVFGSASGFAAWGFDSAFVYAAEVLVTSRWACSPVLNVALWCCAWAASFAAVALAANSQPGCETAALVRDPLIQTNCDRFFLSFPEADWSWIEMVLGQRCSGDGSRGCHCVQMLRTCLQSSGCFASDQIRAECWIPGSGDAVV